MSADTDHYLDLLSTVGDVKTKRMFGGVGFFLGTPMIALIAYDTFFLKTDELTQPRFVAEGGKAFSFARGEKTMITSYYTPPDDALESSDAMRPWAKLAVEAARRVAVTKKRVSKMKPASTEKRPAKKKPSAKKR